jgi:hypothetical protein
VPKLHETMRLSCQTREINSKKISWTWEVLDTITNKAHHTGLTKTSKKSWFLDDKSANFWSLQFFQELHVFMSAFKFHEFTKDIFVPSEFQPSKWKCNCKDSTNLLRTALNFNIIHTNNNLWIAICYILKAEVSQRHQVNPHHLNYFW